MSKELKRIELLKKQIMNLGPILPGSISKQYNVCGKKDCRCKHPEDPVKHGPYFQLSFSIKGRSSTMFLKEGEVSEAKRRIRNYQQFKELGMKLTQAYVDHARKNGLLGGDQK